MADLQLTPSAMDKKQAGQRLMQLATGDAHRSKTARLRDIYEEVEAAIQAGVHQTAILAELKSLGLDMSPATFKSALQRIRNQSVTTPPPSPSPTTTAVPPSATPAPSSPIPKFESQYGVHDPRRIDEAMRHRPDMKALSKLARSKKGPI